MDVSQRQALARRADGRALGLCSRLRSIEEVSTRERLEERDADIDISSP
jgi:hypothetical protein